MLRSQVAQISQQSWLLQTVSISYELAFYVFVAHDHSQQTNVLLKFPLLSHCKNSILKEYIGMNMNTLQKWPQICIYLSKLPTLCTFTIQYANY